MKIKCFALICFCLFETLVFATPYTQKYLQQGQIQAVKGDNTVVLTFSKIVSGQAKYLIVENDYIVGQLQLLEKVYHGDNTEYLAHYSLNEHRQLLAGMVVALKNIDDLEFVDEILKENLYHENVTYQQKKVTVKDQREMLFIPAGKFVMGIDDPQSSAYPQHLEMTAAFYIDKYEVSNKDYLRYLKATGEQRPRSWQGKNNKEFDNLYPVIVSYEEAERYCLWAGKRLPTEAEWEKAARGLGYKVKYSRNGTILKKIEPQDYPWGNKWNPLNCNARLNKKKSKLYVNGYRSIYSFASRGKSPFGVVNMSGNAAEWTTSWFKPYAGNYLKHERFGEQVKVIRGGSWFNSPLALTGYFRQFAGIPNLTDDSAAGFRCVQDVTEFDRLEKNVALIKRAQSK